MSVYSGKILPKINTVSEDLWVQETEPEDWDS